MHYTEIDTLVPIILAVQEDNDDAVSLMLELFDRDIDYEAKYGQRRIDPDLKQELQIKLIYITKHFDVQKHLAQRSQNLGQKKNINFFRQPLSFLPVFVVCI